jgi:hypothetical protein
MTNQRDQFPGKEVLERPAVFLSGRVLSYPPQAVAASITA